MFVHRPIPAGKKELTSMWGFPDELKSWSWTGHEGEKMQVSVTVNSLMPGGQIISVNYDHCHWFFQRNKL
jgi:hypothetical protein